MAAVKPAYGAGEPSRFLRNVISTRAIGAKSIPGCGSESGPDNIAGVSAADRALVAQRIEHLTTDQKVWGSNPYERATWEKVD